MNTCPNCGERLAWLDDDGIQDGNQHAGVGECPTCAAYGAHDGPCAHAEPEPTR